MVKPGLTPKFMSLSLSRFYAHTYMCHYKSFRLGQHCNSTNYQLFHFPTSHSLSSVASLRDCENSVRCELKYLTCSRYMAKAHVDVTSCDD